MNEKIESVLLCLCLLLAFSHKQNHFNTKRWLFILFFWHHFNHAVCLFRTFNRDWGFSAFFFPFPRMLSLRHYCNSAHFVSVCRLEILAGKMQILWIVYEFTLKCVVNTLCTARNNNTVVPCKIRWIAMQRRDTTQTHSDSNANYCPHWVHAL